MAHRKQGYRFEKDWTIESRKDRAESIWQSAVTIPVNVEIQFEHRVLNLDKVKEYLANAEKIALMNCDCREYLQNCDAPVKTCLVVDDVAERALYTDAYVERDPKEVSFTEAVKVLEMSHEAGLVHMAYSLGKDRKADDLSHICSCCSCCCGILSGILRFGVAPHLLTGLMTSETNESECTECGVCADRCQFGAREMINGSLSYNPESCFGCGLCVSTCPTNAITLTEKH